MDRRIAGQWLRLLMLLVAVVLGAFAAGWALPLLYPFLLGWLLAYAMNPVVDALHLKLHMPRWMAVAMTLLLFATSMLTIVSALVVRLAQELTNVSGSLQQLVALTQHAIERLLASPEIERLIERINTFYRENPNYQETINNRISDTAKAAAEAGTSLAGAFLNGIIDILASLPQVATIAVVVLLATFFISKDWSRYIGRMAGWFPERTRKRAAAVWEDLRHALFGYIRAQLIMISITAVVVFIGLMIIGVKNALSISLLIGLVDLLPYLGVGAVLVPWIAYLFIIGDWRTGGALSLLYGIVLIARQVIEPKVLASSVGLAPLPTLIAMFVGLKLLGVLGLILGPVAIVILTTCHRAGIFRDIGRYILHGNRFL
ncbi:sporulation integral membrane protein YtvI [Cohnella fermenti]|uniref:Sporulation integral membrane protein YtvI n=1 Tax=Cohnella fermenti TaxID=2565925 RepID=A0A4S4BLT7_9BACL|nr:sporulation integral membrane protein YtvI [Cohnella fermenti]THF73318.1 sporulation integral membrane protein YtvI [Cohnella fermenti]